LQHPGIALIYEAGTADTGFGPQPYFAMEFIQGKRLNVYATQRRLTTQKRLELMVQVCDAVHHAHQRGIIQRDLKPGNILVDTNGQVKVLDFGVALLTDSDAHVTRQTDLGQLIGTLAYMSPEQALGDAQPLDLRSDVYALGVILYELRASKMSYTIHGKAVHEAVRPSCALALTRNGPLVLTKNGPASSRGARHGLARANRSVFPDPFCLLPFGAIARHGDHTRLFRVGRMALEGVAHVWLANLAHFS